MIGMWIKLLAVPYRLLYPAIVLFMSVGIYSISNSPFDILITGLFGVFGYVCVKLECEPAPLILGFILGPLMEENLRRAMLLSRGDPTVFVDPIHKPISFGFQIVPRRDHAGEVERFPRAFHARHVRVLSERFAQRLDVADGDFSHGE